VTTPVTPTSASPPPLSNLLQDSFVLVGLHVDTAEAAIRRLVAPLVEAGFVEEAYADDAWRREQRFPTGLPTAPIPVAIPHADPDHVLRPALAVGLLANEVAFDQMGSDPPLPLAVRIVFLLALKEREQEAVFLRDFMLILQTPGLLESLIRCATPAEVTTLLRDTAAGARPPTGP
jgi:PTS system galactitol-specific IIA component